MGSSAQKRILFSGKVTGDILSDMTHVGALSDQKYDAQSLAFGLGGAPANVARAVQILAATFGGEVATKILTSQGKLGGEEQFDRFGTYAFVEAGQQVIYKLLRHEHIDYMDLCEDILGCGFPINIVVESKDARSIMRQPLVDCAKRDRRDRVSVSQGVIEAEVDKTDFVFIDPTKPYLGESVIRGCLNRNIPTIIDYGLQAPLPDEFDRQRLDFTLKNASIVIVPGDAWVDGMEVGKPDSNRLFEILTSDDYNAEAVILSDGAEPVRVFYKGVETLVPVTPVEGPKYKNGAGDARDGAFLYFLTQGDDVLTAIKKATLMASIKIRYPANEWRNHIRDHLGGSDLF